MNVTFICANYAPSVGGAQTHVQRVAEGLALDHGHHVEVVTTDAILPPGGRDPGTISGRTDSIGGVSVRRVPVARRTHRGLWQVRRALSTFGFQSHTLASLSIGPLGVRFVVEARRAARRSDVVVGVAAPYLTLLAADYGTRRTRAAFAAMPLVHLSGEPLRPWVLRTLRRTRGCTASTTAERDWLVRNGVPAENIALLPPGCDPDLYPDVTPSQARAALGLTERPTVGYLGRLAAHKGIDTLLDAVPMLWASHPDTSILVAGARTGWSDLDAQLDHLDAEANGRLVIREGFRDDERPMLLAACDVVAFPSRQESFGMVTIEAWCARRPVVAGDIQAVRCLISPGENGELIPVGDADGLAASVGKLLDDPAQRHRMGAAGRAAAVADYSWATIVDRWDSFLSDTVARRAQAQR